MKFFSLFFTSGVKKPSYVSCSTSLLFRFILFSLSPSTEEDQSTVMEAESKAAKNPKDQSISQSPKLPDDLIFFEILSRLPVQCLAQCRCVCKSWRSMISDRQFIKNHLHRSTKSTDCQRILLASHPSHDYFRSLACEFPHHIPKKLKSPLMNPNTYPKPLCACDGLILLKVCHKPFPIARAVGNSFLLWNPMIRAYRGLRSPFPIQWDAIHGICYDPHIDDYRVVIVCKFLETSVIGFCNSKSGSWKKMEEPCYSILSRESGVVVNGAHHWVMTSKKSGSWVIVYFDLVEEKFKEVPRPSFGDEGNNEIDLVVLRGFLCLYRCVDGVKVEIWAMKEHGKKESWAKLIVIPHPINCHLKPLCFIKKGEVLVEIGNREILIYDPKDGTFRSAWRCNGVNSLRPVTYVEGLVLSNGDSEVEVLRLRHQAIAENKKHEEKEHSEVRSMQRQ